MDEKLVLKFKIKNLYIYLILFNSYFMYTQKSDDIFHRNWIISKTLDYQKVGWSAYIDNYILDFTNIENLFIKTLGDEILISLKYRVDLNQGIIYDKNGDILYKIKELSSGRLILYMGNENSSVAIFSPLITPTQFNFNDLSTLLKVGKWFNGTNYIQFTNEKYMVADEIETNYNIFLEYDENCIKHKGAWLIDHYNSFIFIELFSELYNYKGIYIINNVSSHSLEAESINQDRDKFKIFLRKN